MSARRGGEGGQLGAALLIALALLAVGGFVVTRIARGGDDIVNTVALTPALERGEKAEVAFTLTRADADADVLVIDGFGRRVRALEQAADLAAGRQELSWDGRDDDGRPVPPGPYALRIVLGEQGRDIRPPGRIRVLPAEGG